MLLFILYIVVGFCQWRSVMLCNSASVFPRHQLLNCIIVLKTFGFALHCLNVITFSFDGQASFKLGILFARLLGEIARLMSTCLLCLLLILLGHGWSFGNSSEILLYSNVVIIWGLLTSAHFLLFFISFFFVDDVLQDIDIFKSWPGHGMILIRMLQALWFFIQIRRLINEESEEQKAVFLAHFGAGFLVWFVCILGLGIIVSLISALWRFKMILVITTAANFAAVTCLVHLFWSTSSNRHYFLADIMLAVFIFFISYISYQNLLVIEDNTNS
ncbi:unnamed protein product [Onchocerca flexuosa]|uniref:GpcrRhopsn4 domain-containing protein n=1 Tax=Onchocerca flexuosa TaxID=387005 RepID=A0A183HRS3_9BILA|nr:unnamed protein product [Onchocerca flexuosa]